MKRITTLTVLFFAFGLLFTSVVSAQQQRDTSAAQGQQQTQQQQTQQRGQQQAQQSRDQMATKGNLVRAEELKGMTVRNMQGEELATVQDAIVNTSTGKVDYVILQRGGVAGIGGDMIPVPINSFQVTKDKRLVLNMSKDRLEKAPTLAKTDWPPADEQKWARNVQSYFSRQAAEAGQRPTASGQARQPGQTQPTPMGKQ